MNSLIYNAGTVSVSAGSPVVTGNLTGWAVALVEGGVFSCDGLSIPILSVEDDTHLTLAYAWAGPNGSGKLYAIARTPSEATARAATWTVDRLGKLAQTPWGVGVVPDGRGTLAQRNALNPMPNDDYCWLRVEVDQPLELYFRVSGQWLGPYDLKGDASEVPGPPGDEGPPGPPNSLEIGTVEGGDTADAEITGSAPNQTLNLTLPKGDKGDTGDTGPAGTITGATATGLAAGASPTVTLGGTPQARTFAFGIPKGDKGDKGDTGNTGADGNDGTDGDDGWTPVFAVVDDGARRVQQVSDWTGGTGAKPATGQYVGPSGFVTAIGDAVDIRGASGSGTGDMLAATYDPQNIVADAFDRANHTGELPLAALEQGTSGTGVVVGRNSPSGPLGGLLLAAGAFANSVPVRSGGGVLQVGTPTAGAHATTKDYVDNALAGKFNNPTGTASQYIRGDGSLSNFPAIPAGTVTSVGLSAPTGFSVSGSPVTGSGTLALTYASGYTGFTTTLQTKLNGIAAGATANQSDAYLINRANHTNEMPLSALEQVAGGARVVGRTAAGAFGALTLAVNADASTVPYRGAGGILKVGTPAADEDAVPKLHLDTALATKETLGEQAGINTQTGAAYTLGLPDKGKVVEMNNSSANTLTIPTNASVAFPINTRIDLVQFGSGQTTIAGESGVVIYSADGNTKLNKQYSGATLYKRSTNGWVLVGDLVA